MQAWSVKIAPLVQLGTYFTNPAIRHIMGKAGKKFEISFSGELTRTLPNMICLYRGRHSRMSMLLLIQDKVIRQKDPGPLPPYPQSSARMTPYPRLPLAGDDPRKKRDLELFAGNPITVPDKFPAVAVPALHFPASGSDSRQVHVYAYEDDSEDRYYKIGMDGFKLLSHKLIK